MLKKYFFFLLLISCVALYAQNSGNEGNTQASGIQFTLHPNPVSDGVVYIKSPVRGSKIALVYDIFGKLVLRKRIDDEILSVHDLPSGVYVLQLLCNGSSSTKKLVVK